MLLSKTDLFSTSVQQAWQRVGGARHVFELWLAKNKQLRFLWGNNCGQVSLLTVHTKKDAPTRKTSRNTNCASTRVLLYFYLSRVKVS